MTGVDDFAGDAATGGAPPPPTKASQTNGIAPTSGRRGQLFGFSVLGAVVAGFGALFFTFPLMWFVPSFWLSVVLGFVATVMVLLVLSWKFKTRSLVFVGVAVFVIPFGILAAIPLGDDPVPPKPSPWEGEAWQGIDVQHWDLPTGSRIGYTHFVPAEPIDAAPVVFLHGGPGGGIVPQDGIFAQNLVADGYEVYLFDQAGVGWSDLLDVEEYTIDRMVADLEAIRIEIGAEQLNLVGHSWGGSYATHYLVAHDDRVERAWLTNPGEYGGQFAPRDPSEEPNLTAATSGALFNRRPPVRFGVAMFLNLFGAKPGAAEDMANQEQLIRLAPKVVDTVEAFQDGRCANNPYLPGELDFVPSTNFNFYVNTQLNGEVERHSKSDGLSRILTPLVVARGVCDHLAWDSQRHYRDNVAGAQLVVIQNEGHDMRPHEAISSFFRTGDSGLEPYTSNDVPSPN